MKHILPHAIARVIAPNQGLSKLILPRTLPIVFRHEVAAAINAASGGNSAFVVGDRFDDGEISPEQAIAFRTPEAEATSQVVLISTAAQFRELKSLEAFRDLLVQGLPGELNGRGVGLLNIRELCAAVAGLVKDAVPVEHFSEHALADALFRVAGYLAAAYEASGNAEVEWAEAFWQHLDQIAQRLPLALVTLPGHSPSAAVYAAAALPSPDNPAGHFQDQHDPTLYATIVSSRWDRVESIQKAVDEIAFRSLPVASTEHPMMALDWVSFPATRIALRHPILAVVYHGVVDGDAQASLTAWAATSEAAFFEHPVEEDIEATLLVRSSSEEWLPVTRVEWDPAIYICPSPPNKVDDDGTIYVGEFRAVLSLGVQSSSATPSVKLEVRPKTVATALLGRVQVQAGQLSIDFTLKRRVPKRVGSWKEKAFIVEVSPTYIGPDSAFREAVEFLVLVPNPARPTVLIGETKTKGAKTKLRYHSDTSVQLDPTSRQVSHVLDPERPPEVNLESDRSSVHVVTVDAVETVGWQDGEPFQLKEPLRGLDAGWIFPNVTVPEDATLLADGYAVGIKQPTIESGRYSPIVAAATKEPLTHAHGDFLKRLETDPRADIERWLAHYFVETGPAPHLRQTLGISVISSDPSHSTGSIAWSEQNGIPTDMQAFFNFKLPAGLKDSAAVASFWNAFDALQLRSLSIEGSETALWPSALDLSRLHKDTVEAYLDAYLALVSFANTSALSSIAAYPLSVAVFDPSRGAPSGILLSPLHPIRLAWNWSAQNSGHDLAANAVYGDVAPAFLRFIDGEKLPLVGPDPSRRAMLLSLGLSSGPEGFFAAWSMLAGLDIHRADAAKSIVLLGRKLPLSAPSGLDSGGITAALRDYLRVYPSTPQLRIALSASSRHERSPDIDEAVLTAASSMLVRESDRLPGGMRVYDSERRSGAPPDAHSALRRLQVGSSERTGPAPAFEWIAGHEGVSVDLQFVEDALVEVDVRRSDDSVDVTGCVGPQLPINRFNVWQRLGVEGYVSTASALLHSTSYSGLRGFLGAVSALETVSSGSRPAIVEGRLKLGQALLGKRSRWTITGNRNLDPAMLSEQLKDSGDGLALWEWRPAFLSREQQREASFGVSASHPYTVLARPSEGFLKDLKATLADCTGSDDSNATRQLLGELGVRGVGLSSLLTMGHTQSVGAVGFYLAFKALSGWEATNQPNEVRFVVPLDAVYPLIDLLAVGGKSTDAQRRADLLLFKADMSDPDNSVLYLHPLEIKMRTSGPAAFPGRADNLLKDPADQLKSTREKIERMAENYRSHGRHQPLVNGALATLVEAALALRPASIANDPNSDLQLISKASSGGLSVFASNGTILWLRKDGHSSTGAHYERRMATAREPGVVLVNPLLAFEELSSTDIGEVRKAAAAVVESSFPSTRPPAGNNRPPPPTPGRGDAPSSGDDAPPDRPNNGHSSLQPISPAATGVTANEPSPTATEASNSAETTGATKVTHDGETLGADVSATTSLPAEESHAAGVSALVGEGSHQGRWSEIHFRPSNTSLNQLNVGVVGDLGTGKTQFLQSLVYQLTRSASANRGIAPKAFIFDYKQDYTGEKFSAAIGAQVLDPAYAPIPINFFALPKNATRVEKVRRAHFFRDVFKRIVSIGAVQANALYESVMRAYEDSAEGHAPTLDDVLDIYRSRDGTRDDSVVSQLKLMVDLEIFEKRTANTTNFEGLFARNTVLSLRNIGAGQEVVDIIVSLFLDLLYNEYMIKRSKRSFETGEDGVQRRFIDSFVLVDEAHHIMSRGFDVLMSLLLEGREFGMGVILSSQYLSHFKEGGKNWSEALSTWVVHKIRVKAKELEEIGFRKEARNIEQSIGDIERHFAFYRCADGYNDGILMKGQPFFSLLDT
jgi:hypothetical protein